jgi:hypothetical protein
MVLKITRVNKKSEDGTKTYEYDHHKYYDHYKEKKGRTVCPICLSDVSNIYLQKHQMNSKKCKTASIANKENQFEGCDDDKNKLIEQLNETLRQLNLRFGIKK